MGALVLTAVALLAGADDAHPRRRSATDARQPPMGLEVAARPGSCPKGGCRAVVFSRPTGCEVAKRWPTRLQMRCRSEARREVLIGDSGIVSSRPLEAVAARNPYPWELVGQWRRCPYRDDAGLEAVAVPYEDPEVGRCYVLREGPSVPPSKRTGLGMLKTLHPYLADCVRRMIAAAHARGDEIKVISGNRAPKKVTEWVQKTVRKDGKKVKVKVRRTRFKGGGWHAFGLAVDVNLMHRKDLSSATAAFLAGPPERDVWERLGADGEAFGLKWLGRTKPGEIFHFEWHPTWPGMPKGKLYRKLARQSERHGLPAVWARLRHDPDAPSPFKHLRD